MDEEDEDDDDDGDNSSKIDRCHRHNHKKNTDGHHANRTNVASVMSGMSLGLRMV